MSFRKPKTINWRSASRCGAKRVALALGLGLSLYCLPALAQDQPRQVPPLSAEKMTEFSKALLAAKENLETQDKVAQEALKLATQHPSVETRKAAEEACQAFSKASDKLRDAKLNGFHMGVYGSNLPPVDSPSTPTNSGTPNPASVPRSSGPGPGGQVLPLDVLKNSLPAPADGGMGAKAVAGLSVLFLIGGVTIGYIVAPVRQGNPSGRKQVSNDNEEQNYGIALSSPTVSASENPKRFQPYLEQLKLLAQKTEAGTFSYESWAQEFNSIIRLTNSHTDQSFKERMSRLSEPLAERARELRNINSNKEKQQKKAKLRKDMKAACEDAAAEIRRTPDPYTPPAHTAEQNTPMSATALADTRFQEPVYLLQVTQDRTGSSINAPANDLSNKYDYTTSDAEVSEARAMAEQVRNSAEEIRSLQAKIREAEQEKERLETNNRQALQSSEQTQKRLQKQLLQEKKSSSQLKQEKNESDIKIEFVNHDYDQLLTEHERLTSSAAMQTALRESLPQFPISLRTFTEGLLQVATVIEGADANVNNALLETLDQFVYHVPLSYGRVATDGSGKVTSEDMMRVTALQAWAHDRLQALSIQVINPGMGEPLDSSRHKFTEDDEILINDSPARDNTVASVKRIGYEVKGQVQRKAEVKRYVFTGPTPARSTYTATPSNIPLQQGTEATRYRSDSLLFEPLNIEEDDLLALATNTARKNPAVSVSLPTNGANNPGE